MSRKDDFELLFGSIPVVPFFRDSISLISTDRLLSPEDRAKMDEFVWELRRLAKNNPVTFEGVRVLDRHRRGPALQNIPMPRTEEGDRFRLLMHKMRKETWPEMTTFLTVDYAALERRLIQQPERTDWTLQDCHWRDGEE